MDWLTTRVYSWIYVRWKLNDRNRTAASMNIDIVIPVLNEQDSLSILIDEIEAVTNANSINAMVIFVDDGSNDESWNTIESICKFKNWVGGLRLAENYGKSTALTTGFLHCNSEIVFTMDADLQDNPIEIPRFIEAITRHDLVCGWKRKRNDSANRRLLSRGFNFLVNVTTRMKLHDHNCGFKAIRREQLTDLNLDRGMHRFLTVLVAANGGCVGEIVVNHRPRQFGRSKYGIGRSLRGFRGLLRVLRATRFARQPASNFGRETTCEVSQVAGFLKNQTARKNSVPENTLNDQSIS